MNRAEEIWIVAIIWSYYEQDIVEFDDEIKAREYYESWADETEAVMYLARVERKKGSIE